MGKKVRIGIIGAGGISHAHMIGYSALENVEVCAVCDINKPRADEFAKKYDVEHVFTDCEKMVGLEKLDAVSICTWNNMHAANAITALNAGKHVLCEKPMAVNVREAKEMMRAAKAAKKLLMIGFVRRFGSDAAVVKDFIDGGRLGDIYYSKASYLRRCGNPGGWFSDSKLSGGGPLIDLGVHVIDLVRYLMGKPKAVSAYGAAFRGLGPGNVIKSFDWYKSADYSSFSDVEDFVTAMVRFDNGAVLSVETSFNLNIREDVTNIELFGTKSGMRMEPVVELYTQTDGYIADIIPKIIKPANWFESIFKKQTAHFIQCITGMTECINPAEDGVELMRIIEAVYESAGTGREAVIKR